MVDGLRGAGGGGVLGHPGICPRGHTTDLLYCMFFFQAVTCNGHSTHWEAEVGEGLNDGVGGGGG